ncbi:hypothetical protein [Flavobacterium psychrophilum]|uniref:Uncharacterized protein n=1 Tax=Flavobacterium psychrophilum TaxID=96345 RepID=A0A7U2NFH5_FLAPS|nr:hypothetical protein [Flavobacterium psychrophilum]OAE92116.1 hypothetical protein SU65_10190 [Flavobacterium psychrophilum]QRE04184.1 hypothetical protein H0H26_00835 [Flavobacterium psychrophilum]
MKHWSEFLEQRTHATKRLGKLANPLTYEVQEKELQLQNAKLNLERFELQICNKIAGNYTNEVEYENAILNAKAKANEWNNSPIDSHKPTHKNQKKC